MSTTASTTGAVNVRDSWALLQDHDGPTILSTNHPYHEAWKLMTRILMPRAKVAGEACRALISSHPVDEMFFIMNIVYMKYYIQPAPTLNDIVLQHSLSPNRESPVPFSPKYEGYTPPEEAPWSVKALFRDPGSPIRQSHMEQAMQECLDVVLSSFAERVKPWLARSIPGAVDLL